MHRSSFIARRTSSFVLALLLLVPLATSGHHHAADTPSAAPCAVCVVAHHAPAAVASPLTPFALELAHAIAVAPTGVALPVRIPSLLCGRAPPVVSSTLAIS